MCKVQILSSLSLSHPDVVRICVGGRSLLQAALHTLAYERSRGIIWRKGHEWPCSGELEMILSYSSR